MFQVYDLETFINCFLFGISPYGEDKVEVFEISDRRNDRDLLLKHLGFIRSKGDILVGYNNLGFDYPILHQLLHEPYTFDALKAYNLAQTIISQQVYGRTNIRLSDRLIPQLDLMKMNHFDNPAKRTRLKDLQFAMRSESVEDLPYPAHMKLNSEQMDELVLYNVHDITETKKFLGKCMPMINIRQELVANGTLAGDVLNFSDVKLGTEYLIKKIGRTKCFLSGSTPRQTKRHEINFSHLILPHTAFTTQPFQDVLEWFKSQVYYIGRTGASQRPGLETTLAGIDFKFGIGGVHASVERKVYRSNETHVIKDVDVAGMYPAVALANGMYPEHLGQDFATAYRQLSVDRAQYPKGSTMNLILKLANNGVFGNSNNEYSCFYDPKYTFNTTINGQLQLIMLVEMLSLIPGLEIIQANTDGTTVYMPRDMVPWFQSWCHYWEEVTKLKLEHAEYRSMFIRDVNNYVAVDVKGTIKRKGCYWYPIVDADYQGSSGPNWNKDFSNLASIKCAEASMLHNVPPEIAIRTLTDPFDFMLRYKTQGDATVYLGEKAMLRTVRYYVSTAGEKMKKIAKPKGEIGAYKRKNKLIDEFFNQVLASLPPDTWDARIHTGNKSRYTMAVTNIENGRLVKCCNLATDFNWSDVDFDYYIEEARKIILC